MKVMILSAGQGKRLLPLTRDVPKALLDVGGMPMVTRQIHALAACGLRDFLVVTGYGHDVMSQALAATAQESGLNIDTLYNPFFAVADNLASCWMARNWMNGDFLQINGDNIFQPALARHLLEGARDGVTVAINIKDAYDGDDMKVMLDRGRLTEIGKTLPVEAVDAEATGFYVFRGDGVRLYRNSLESLMAHPAGLTRWFPAAVGHLAKQAPVAVRDLSGHVWCEVDSPSDLHHARQLVANW